MTVKYFWHSCCLLCCNDNINVKTIKQTLNIFGMSKWAHYLISHVRHDEQNRITHVLLHVDKGETLASGVSKNKDEVISLLKQGYEIETTTWNYPKWFRGAKVDYVREDNGNEYLRTLRNNTERDNLDNLIPL